MLGIPVNIFAGLSDKEIQMLGTEFGICPHTHVADGSILIALRVMKLIDKVDALEKRLDSINGKGGI